MSPAASWAFIASVFLTIALFVYVIFPALGRLADYLADLYWRGSR